MEQLLNDLIRTANLLYGNRKADNRRFSNALEYYKKALEYLFNIRAQQDRSHKEYVERVIENVLLKAEDCQARIGSFEEQKVAASNNRKLPNQLSQSSHPKQSQSSLASRDSMRSSRVNRTTELNQYELAIEQEIIERSPNVSWSNISGLSAAKEILQETIIKPSLYPDIYTGLRAPPRGILLFGPPGTGKTLLAKAVASECRATFLNVSASTLTSKNYGDAEKLVRALFSVARKHQPSVIFIDEVDSVLGARRESQHEASRRLETEFLIQIDGVASTGDERVVLIAATNRPDELDEAVRRRLTKRIYIPLPDPETRQVLVSSLIKGNSNLGDQDVRWVVNATDGYSGSDLSNLCKEAALDSVRGLSEAELRSGNKFFISKKNFERALKVIRPSVQRSSLAFYERWNQEFGVR